MKPFREHQELDTSVAGLADQTDRLLGRALPIKEYRGRLHYPDADGA